MNLDIEQGWHIECYRCSNEAFTEGGEADDATVEFLEMGWRQHDDGYQICPQCWGLP